MFVRLAERRSDGVSVVQLPWGVVYLDPQNVGQVISSQYKRTRYVDDDDDGVDDHSATRRKHGGDPAAHHSAVTIPVPGPCSAPPSAFTFSALPPLHYAQQGSMFMS